MTKIGKRLCITVGVLMLACTVSITATNAFLFYRRNNDILTAEEKVDTTVLNNRMNALYETVDSIAGNIAANDTFVAAEQSNDIDTISHTIDAFCGTQSVFAVLTDTSGEVKYSTADFNAENIPVKNLTSGFVLGEKDLGIYYLSVKQFTNTTLAVGLDMSKTEYVDDIKALTGAEVTIFADKTRLTTTFIDEKGERCVGTKMNDDIANAIKNGNKYTGRADIFEKSYECTYYPLMNGKNYVGALFIGTSATEGDLATMYAVIISVTIGIIVVSISIACMIVFVKKRIVAPVVAANTLSQQMSQGILKAEKTECKFFDDEISSMVQTIISTQQTLDKYVEDISRVLSAMSSGDFTVNASMNYAGDFVEINKAFDGIIERLGAVISRINETSANVTAGTAQIATGSQLLADGTTRQAAAIEELSASISEIADKVQRNAENAAEANRCAVEASEKVDAQAKSMAEVHDAMSDIHAKSEQISDIIKTIEDIAFQTNILALNAAVEAARAGDAGRGFAVVADEVRNLASKSDEAAKQTADIINDTIHAVNHGSIIVDETVKDVKSVTEITKQMQTLVNTISAASEEQSVAIEQINTGVVQISEVVQQNSATAEESAASCDELNNHANVLNQQISQFKVNNK